MKQIRKGVFETNSSSTHSICIAKEAELTIPQEVHFELGRFGWECDTLKSMEEKASYLYTGLLAEKRGEDFKNIISTLESKGIQLTFDDPKESEYFYVDHSDELKEFLDAICSEEGKLMRYLFSDLSFIITGNDNDDEDVAIRVTYPYDSYFKGN